MLPLSEVLIVVLSVLPLLAATSTKMFPLVTLDLISLWSQLLLLVFSVNPLPVVYLVPLLALNLLEFLSN